MCDDDFEIPHKKMKREVSSPNPRDTKQSCLNKSLYWAVKNFHNTEIVSALLEKGADINIFDDPNETLLDIAVRFNRFNYVKLLLNQMVEEKEPINLQKLLQASAIDRKMDIFKLLISYSDGYLHNKWIPKEIIINYNQYQKYFEIFCDHGFTVNPDDKDNSRLMFSAVEKGLTNIVICLLKFGAKLEPNSYTKPLVITAMYQGNANIITMLIEHGACIKTTDRLGNTPLHIAAKKSWIKIMELLLKKDVEVNVTNNLGMTPLHLAASSSNAVYSGQIIQRLIDNNAIIECVDNKGETPLHVACKVQNLEAIKILLKNGADVFIQDNSGTSPLLNACKNGDATITRALLRI